MNIDEAIQIALQHVKSGDLQQAEKLLIEILKTQPNNATAITTLGIVSYYLKNYDSAIEYGKRALYFSPTNAYIYYTLGNAFSEKKQFYKAISCYQRALELNPNDSKLFYSLGLAFKYRGKLEEAKSCFNEALRLNPNLVDAYINLGVIFNEKRNFVESTDYFEKALQLDPTNSFAYHGIAHNLFEINQFQEAIKYYEKSLNLFPNNADVYNNIGIILMTQGKLDEAKKYFKHALKLKPDELRPYANILMMMNYNSDYDAKRIFSEHVQFAKHFCDPLYPTTHLYTNKRTPNRRLKVGYVSPDFRRHPVACFIEPVIKVHSNEYFDVYCYSNSKIRDQVTERIQRYADHWRDITEITDEEASGLIRVDEIDILVDLAGYTGDNRVQLFARKPAPIQVSWIGYLTTTGLSAINYKIADNYTDPLCMTEQFYTEELIRLPESFLCYLPDEDSPKVNNLPALLTGNITFGSFNNFRKVRPEVFTLWAKVLNVIPGSRLIMKGKNFFDKSTCQYAINMFIQRGIAPERITLLSSDPSPKHLESYNQVDIGLDTFPFNGAATTCEAMWMGVPVITLAGAAYHSRTGISLLSNVGLPELVAKTSDEYVSIAVNLAKDLQRLRSIRERLRDMIKYSPLCDAKKFTLSLEMCYSKMWETWCKSV